MAERDQVQRPQGRRESEAEELDVNVESGEAIKSELDDLLDEIDDVLETNAEEFVKSYVQKGGQ